MNERAVTLPMRLRPLHLHVLAAMSGISVISSGLELYQVKVK